MQAEAKLCEEKAAKAMVDAARLAKAATGHKSKKKDLQRLAPPPLKTSTTKDEMAQLPATDV